MSTAAISGTDASRQEPPAAPATNGNPKAKLLRAAADWLAKYPALVVLLVILLGVPGYVPGYFELERAERRELRAAHAAEERENRRVFLLANSKLVDRLGTLVTDQTRAIDELAQELRRGR